jgi:crossover junction endodeoxyribonuclease RuvC
MAGARVFVGIDPGVTGAVAILERAPSRLYMPYVIDVPSVEIKVGARRRREINLPVLGDLIKRIIYRDDNRVVAIEQVGTMPTDGRVGAFSFGKGYGIWLMGLAMVEIEPVEVSPLRWKRYWGILGADKNASREKARELWPAASEKLKRVKDHNRAEALLIAEWLRRNAETTSSLAVG